MPRLIIVPGVFLPVIKRPSVLVFISLVKSHVQLAGKKRQLMHDIGQRVFGSMYVRMPS